MLRVATAAEAADDQEWVVREPRVDEMSRSDLAMELLEPWFGISDSSSRGY